MAKRKTVYWTDEEILQAIDALPLVVEESGGHSISNKSDALRRLASKLGRTHASVNNRLRKLADEDPTYDINKYRSRGKIDQPEDTPEVEQTTPTEVVPERSTARVVNIPLKKLYGLLDYETFMSLIDG
jgi:hypothetical protein